MMTKQAELKQKAYHSGLKSRALSILIYLIDRSNKDLTCFPAIPTMAEHLHISVSTVKRALHELVDSGFVKKEARFREKNRGQTSNLYTLVFPENIAIPEALLDNTEMQKEIEQLCEVHYITFADIATSGKEQVSVKVDTEQIDDIQDKTKPICKSTNCKSTPVQQIDYKRTCLYLGIHDKKKAVPENYCFAAELMWSGVEVNLLPP